MKIEIEVEDVTKQMFLRSEVGTATLPDGTEIEITNLINGSLHFKIKGKSYLVSVRNVLEAILEKID